MGLLRKFFGRTLADQVLLVRAFVLVVLVRLGLDSLTYRTVYGLVDVPLASPPGAPSDQAEYMYQRRVVGAVESVGRRLLGDRPCLVQALVVRRLMRQAGYEVVMHIGVAKEEGEDLAAHAWLERNGRVIVGGAASPTQYKSLTPVAS